MKEDLLTREKVAKIPARQARSQKTQERIVRAAREMLEARSWEDLTMADLAKAAGCHVGSIYARFESKAALLDHLDEIYAREILALNKDLLNQMEGTSLTEAVSGFVKGVADYHAANAGLIRTLIIETRAFGHPEFHARSKRMNASVDETAKAFARLARAEGHRASATQIGWALFFVISSVREATLYPAGVPRPSTVQRSQVKEITAMALRYLEAA